MISSRPVSGFVSFLMTAARLIPDESWGHVMEPDDDWYRVAVIDDALRAYDRKMGEGV